MPRNRQPFRPYRLTPRSAKTSHQPRIKTPYEPPFYPLGFVVCCLDKTDREIVKIESRGLVWAYHWQAGSSRGVTVESALKRQDVFLTPCS